MKILVIGLDGVDSEFLFKDARLENLRRLMEFGCFGKLSFQGTSDRLNLWVSLVAGQNLGPQGEAGTEDLEAIQEIAIWKQIEEQNKGVIVVGLPPFVSYPIEMKTRVDDSFLDVGLLGEKLTTQDAHPLKDQIYTVSNKQLDLVRSLIQSEEWDYFQFIDDGLHQLQRSEIINSDSDPEEMHSNYYLHLDEGVGTILELLDDSTIVLVVSLQATKPTEGSFILAFSNNPLSGEIEGANLFDIAPTLLELGGYEELDSMQGNSLVAGKMLKVGNDMDLSAEEEEILRERFSGLGYIS